MEIEPSCRRRGSTSVAAVTDLPHHLPPRRPLCAERCCRALLCTRARLPCAPTLLPSRTAAAAPSSARIAAAAPSSVRDALHHPCAVRCQPRRAAAPSDLRAPPPDLRPPAVLCARACSPPCRCPCAGRVAVPSSSGRASLSAPTPRSLLCAPSAVRSAGLLRRSAVCRAAAPRCSALSARSTGCPSQICCAVLPSASASHAALFIRCSH